MLVVGRGAPTLLMLKRHGKRVLTSISTLVMPLQNKCVANCVIDDDYHPKRDVGYTAQRLYTVAVPSPIVSLVAAEDPKTPKILTRDSDALSLTCHCWPLEVHCAINNLGRCDQ
jgi:hypothetical protein